MLIDLFFLGFPIFAAVCLAVVAVRESSPKFWHCSFSFIAYCAFYLAGGREIILFILAGMVIGGGYLCSGGTAGSL
ncbi:MAG: hypothetical protein K2W95_08285 [Candidatus Obscuribacterales bacterium]|nr:hypothetical protein [Candidatus Obscuribacterales bacterium]